MRANFRLVVRRRPRRRRAGAEGSDSIDSSPGAPDSYEEADSLIAFKSRIIRSGKADVPQLVNPGLSFDEWFDFIFKVCCVASCSQHMIH